MKRLSTWLIAAVLPLGLLSGGCSTLTPELTKTGALAAFKPLEASRRDTCATQRQIAEHNARYDSLRHGKVVAYRAACDAKPAKDAPASEPKTS